VTGTGTAEVPDAADAGTGSRTVTVRLCRWGDVRTVRDGAVLTREVFDAPGALTLADRVYVVDSHHGDLIGRVDVDSFRDDGTGPVVDLTLAATARGRDVAALLDADVLDAVSIEYAAATSTADADGVQHRTGVVHGVAFTFHPAHDAPVMAVRSIHQEETTMSVPTMPDTPAVPALPDTADTADVVTGELLTRSLDTLRDELARDLSAVSITRHTGGHPLMQYRSLVDYADAVYAGDADPLLLMRTLADQVTADNPGVLPPAWVTTVAGIIDQSRPTITAFGQSPLPPTGMEVDWPYFDGDLAALVAAQTAEKTAITSVKVSLKKGSADLVTYAGGSDVSYQLIRRSSPSYRDAYLRIMFNAYALVTNKAAAAAAVDAATASAGLWPLSGTGSTADKLSAALFIASTEVEAATGRPASFALAATDVFTTIGALVGLVPARYGTFNVPGTADAATLAVAVSGLPVIHDQTLPAGSLIVSNDEAAS
jgi:phage head maturation protease